MMMKVIVLGITYLALLGCCVLIVISYFQDSKGIMNIICQTRKKRTREVKELV